MKTTATEATPNRMSDMPDELKPREKAMTCGIKALTDAELMALIFSTGIKGKSVLQMCTDILADNDNHISKVAGTDVKEFIRRYKGIGAAKALTMLAALELGSRAAADAMKLADVKITTPESAYRYMSHKFDGLDHEEFWVLLLKQNGSPLRPVKIAQGGLTATVVDHKIIFREALAANAPRLMLFHNHPSGSLQPSAQDIALTKKICDAARLLDIAVLDHIIIGAGYYSFHDQGRMP